MASESEKVVSEFCRAWPRLNLDEIMAFFAEDAVYHNVPMPEARGKAAIRAAINSFLPMFKKVEFEVLRTASSGTLVMNERIDRFETDGKKVALPVAGVFEIAGGKIKLWRDYFDLAQWTRQMSGQG